MQSKLIVKLKSGEEVEFTTLEHLVNVSGDLVIGDINFPAMKWESVRIEESKPANRRKAVKKENKVES